MEVIVVGVKEVVDFLVCAEDKEFLLHLRIRVILNILWINLKCSYLTTLKLEHLIDFDFAL